MAEFQRRDGENTGPRLCALGGGRVLYSVQPCIGGYELTSERHVHCHGENTIEEVHSA